jgi:cobalt-zinc-cadmium efflux system membrane fusion protein
MLRAPGEVRTNRYATAQISSRISGQVIARHVYLGERVSTGEALVTISSVEMAEAQGAVVAAAREWQRVRSLGRKVVSESRYLGAEIAH